jgi:hypothetical protein
LYLYEKLGYGLNLIVVKVKNQIEYILAYSERLNELVIETRSKFYECKILTDLRARPAFGRELPEKSYDYSIVTSIVIFSTGIS